MPTRLREASHAYPLLDTDRTTPIILLILSFVTFALGIAIMVWGATDHSVPWFFFFLALFLMSFALPQIVVFSDNGFPRWLRPASFLRTPVNHDWLALPEVQNMANRILFSMITLWLLGFAILYGLAHLLHGSIEGPLRTVISVSQLLTLVMVVCAAYCYLRYPRANALVVEFNSQVPQSGSSATLRVSPRVPSSDVKVRGAEIHYVEIHSLAYREINTYYFAVVEDLTLESPNGGATVRSGFTVPFSPGVTNLKTKPRHAALVLAIDVEGETRGDRNYYVLPCELAAEDES